jgi:hypothetical protein
MHERLNVIRYALAGIFAIAVAFIAIACGGDGDETLLGNTPRPSGASPGVVQGTQGNSSPGPTINNVEGVVLTQRDVPLDFSRVEDGTSHLSLDESCSRGNPEPEAKQECLDNMREWGRQDTYQVIFRTNNQLDTLSGTGMFEILNVSSVHEDRDGANEAYDWGREQLQARLNQGDDARLVTVPTVGEESVAFVVDTTDSLFGRQIELSYYSIDFRQGNVLVRVATVAPKVLATSDEVLALARIVDERIKAGGGSPQPAVTPSTSPAASPSPAATATPAS